MILTNRQKLLYYRKRKMVRHYILSWARKNKAIVYGATGLNIQMPPHLKSVTKDVDMYIRNPKISAYQLESYLDEVFGGDYFEVEPAKYEHTYKIRSRVTSEAKADLTKPKTKIHSKYVSGQRVASLKQIKKNRKRSLRMPENKFRHKKDLEALQRIKLSRKNKAKMGKGLGLPTLKKWTTRLPMKPKKPKKGGISLW